MDDVRRPETTVTPSCGAADPSIRLSLKTPPPDSSACVSSAVAPQSGISQVAERRTGGGRPMMTARRSGLLIALLAVVGSSFAVEPDTPGAGAVPGLSGEERQQLERGLRD